MRLFILFSILFLGSQVPGRCDDQISLRQTSESGLSGWTKADHPKKTTSHVLVIEDVGVSVVVPDDWNHDPTDSFGFVIRPEGEKDRKIRIHLTGHQDIPPAEAVRRGSEKVNEMKKNLPPETILSSEPIMTKSGIQGHKAEVGQQGPNRSSYLTRMYFAREDGRIFCTCVYHYGDMDFSGRAEEKILESLQFTFSPQTIILTVQSEQ